MAEFGWAYMRSFGTAAFQNAFTTLLLLRRHCLTNVEALEPPLSSGPDLAGGGPGAQLTWGH